MRVGWLMMLLLGWARVAQAGAGLPPMAQAEPPAWAAVEQARGALLDKVRANGLPVLAEAAEADLNGDGVPEIIARLSTPRGCAPLGRPDCPLIVLQRQGHGRWIEIGTFFADRVRLAGTESRGWQELELRFETGPWRRVAWDGVLYRSARR